MIVDPAARVMEAVAAIGVAVAVETGVAAAVETGAAITLTTGLLSNRGVTNHPPLEVLRAEG